MIPHFHSWTIFAATEAEAAVGVVPTWVKLAITVGVFVIPYGLGVLIARQLKLKEYALKISIVLVAATLGLMPFVYQGVLGVFERQHYHQEYAEWEAAQDNKDEGALTADDIDEIIADNPTLNIDTPYADQTSKITSVKE